MKKTVVKYAAVERIEYEFDMNEVLRALRAYFNMPADMHGSCSVTEADHEHGTPESVYVELRKEEPREARASQTPEEEAKPQ